MIIRTSQKISEEEMEDVPDLEEELAVPIRASLSAPRTQLGVPRLRGARTPDMGNVSAGQPDRWTPPEGEPDRCNSADPVEGDIPEGRFQDKKLPQNVVLCHY